MRLFQHHSSVTEPPGQTHDGIEATARVFLLGQESIYPGWYMQRYVDRKLQTTRLDIHENSKALDAVVEAAACLNCPIGEIQVKGLEWPRYPEKN